MSKARKALTRGLLIGAAWGFGVALLDGLSLLWQGRPWPYFGERMVALAYLGAIYGVMGGALGGVVAVFFTVTGRLFPGRTANPVAAGLRGARGRLRKGESGNVGSHPHPGPLPQRERVKEEEPGTSLPQRERGVETAVVGVLAGCTVAMAAGQRFQPGVAGWVVIAVLAIGAGLAAGWVAWRATAARPEPGGGQAGRIASIVVVALFIAALGTVAGVAIGRAWPAQAGRAAVPGDTAPNIVLITADGVRANHLGAYGYDPAISPNLDALAARGVRFEQAIAPGSWSRPSAAALLTSLYPGVLGYACGESGCSSPAPNEQQTTVAEALHAAGYRTAAVVASPWLNDPGFAQGFDRFEAARDQEPFDDAPMRGRMLGRLVGCRKGSALCRLYRQGRGLLFDARLIANQGGEAINATAARFLDRYAGRRFFLWIDYDDALPPYNLAEPFKPLPEGPLASPARRLKSLGYWELGDPFTAREELLPDDAPGVAALYDGEVQRVDRLAGEVLAMLDAHGLTERTLVIFTSGHGQELMDHGGYTYGHTLYEEVVHVPLIIAGPGVTAAPGGEVAGAVSLVDVAPTLAEFGGAAPPAEAQGQSLVPALQGRPTAQQPVYSEALYRVALERYALWRGELKLIYHGEDGSAELYDLAADPGEAHDLAAERPDVVRQMTGEVRQWITDNRTRAARLPGSGLPTDKDKKLW